jgi:mannitol/fructose-specific phosphotransferase system IIA component (Ntr-type)
MKLTEIIQSGSIVANLSSTDRDQAILELINVLVDSGAAPAAIKDNLIERVLDRERKHSTGFGRGVAVPHVKHPEIETMAAAIGISQDGIEFNALDKQPVYTIFLLLSPQSRPEEHLQAMEVIFKNLSKDAFRRSLRQAGSDEKIHQILDDADNHRLNA